MAEGIHQIQTIKDVIKAQWLEEDGSRPWILGYSAGKDSTCLLHLVVLTLLSLPPEDRRRRPFVVTMGDTLVENPVMQAHADKMWALLQEFIPQVLPEAIFVRTSPALDQTFWVLLLGKGYRAPTRDFRWCTDRMKIRPKRYLQELYRNAIWLVGTRRDESARRNAGFLKREGQGNVTHRPSGMATFEPLEHLTTDDLWAFLLQNPPPWGGSHRDLITLYRNAVGECPIVLSHDDAPSCGSQSARFGCWTCTVVKKDKSLQALADGEEGIRLEPLLEFRERLREVSEAGALYRDNRRRNGQPGTGPLTLTTRKTLLQELLQVQQEVGQELITPQEITLIKEIWARDGQRVPLTPEELAFDEPIHFQAIPFSQGSVAHWIATVPFRDLLKICQVPKERPSSEERFQRDTSWVRAEAIAQYILTNRESYVLPPITLCTDTLRYTQDNQILTLRPESKTWIVDGQHRRAGIELAMERDRTLESESIGVLIHTYEDLRQLRQLFSDLNSGKPIPRSVKLFMDRRDYKELAELCETSVFKGLLDPVNTTVSTRSPYLWTLSAVQQTANLNNATLDWWQSVFDGLPGMSDFKAGRLSANQLRNLYVWAHGVGLRAIGELKEFSPEAFKCVDWSRKSSCWEGNAVLKGRMQADAWKSMASEIRRQITEYYSAFELEF